MLRNQNIVCFSVTDYGHDIPVGKDHLMEIFAKNGNKVLMVNLVGTRAPEATKYDFLKILRKIKEWFAGYRLINGIYVINPFRLPFIKYEIINKFNQYVLYIYLKYYFRKFRISNAIFWVLNVLYSDLLKKIHKKALVYYVSDEYSLFTGNAKEVFKEYEKKILKYSNGVITVHKKLYYEKSKYNKNTINILNATNPKHFINFRKSFLPSDLEHLKKPIVGFSGKIEDWVDVELIKECAITYRYFSFVLIGPPKINLDLISELPNVYILGKKSYADLPRYINNFDICILPFVKNGVTDPIDFPLKLVEYFAVGKPIVAININRIDKYSDAYILVKTREEFIGELGLALEKENKELRNRRRQIALENSWEIRAKELSSWIEKTILNNQNRKK